MPLVLYGTTASPPCRAVLVTAEALGLSVELKIVNLAQKEHFSPEFIKVNPQHTVPVLDDDGVIIPDNHAIITYLVSKYGKDDSLYPKDLAKRALVDSRLHFDNGTAFVYLKIVFRGHADDEQTDYLTPWQNKKILDVYDIVNKLLAKNKWIAGDSITVADISLVTTLNSLNVILTIDDSQYPHIRRWLDAANALPFFSVSKPGHEEFKNNWKKVSTH